MHGGLLEELSYLKKRVEEEKKDTERQTERSPPHASVSHEGPPAIFL